MIIPPLNSKVKVLENHKTLTIIIPQELKRPWWRAAAIFQTIAGLGIIALVGRVLISSLRTLPSYTNLLDPLVLIWLGFPMIIMTPFVVQAFFVMRPSTPVKLKLQNDQLQYDSGIKPFVPLPRGTKPAKKWKNLNPKRARVTLNYATLSTMSLNDGQTGNRLTIQYRNKRATLAPHISDANREWLYQTLKDYYRLK